jgi:Ca2+-binding EF-hand superfamily protein
MIAVPLLTTSLVVALQWAPGAIQAIDPGIVAPLAVARTSTDQQSLGRPARMRFEVMDRNNDGEISRDEWRGSARSFDVHDWNGDGRLSGDEVRIGAQQNTNLEEADHNPSRAERYASWTEAGFASLDHNRDGRITSNEWHYDRESFVRADRNRDGALDRAEFLGSDMDDDRGDRFDDLDANGNGRIEREEWHASNDAFMWLDRNRDGVLSRLEVTGEEQAASRSDQFASLDYDGNGTISRNEWHWSLGSFSQRDLNRDGVLSRREFASAAGGADDSTTTPQVVRVSAQQRWTDTGIDVRAGDVLTFDSRGTVQLSSDSNDVATPAGSRKQGRVAPATNVNAAAGALIARIGDSDPIAVADRRSISAPLGGRLYLGINDDHLPDNTGEFEVTVGIQGRTRRY